MGTCRFAIPGLGQVMEIWTNAACPCSRGASARCRFARRCDRFVKLRQDRAVSRRATVVVEPIKPAPSDAFMVVADNGSDLALTCMTDSRICRTDPRYGRGREVFCCSSVSTSLPFGD